MSKSFHARLERSHKYAYRFILVTVLVIDYIEPEWIKKLVKTAPYTLLAFEFYLYSPLIWFKGIVKSPALKLLVIAAIISMNINTVTDLGNPYRKQVAVMREYDSSG